jgi:hypothetical protein
VFDATQRLVNCIAALYRLQKDEGGAAECTIRRRKPVNGQECIAQRCFRPPEASSNAD